MKPNIASKNSLQIINCNREPHKQRGFSLTEILIVVALISLLIVAALPDLRSNAIKANRQDAYAIIADIQQELLEHYSLNQTFANYTPSATISSRGHYQINVSSQTVSNYIITATARGEQAKDDINSFRIDATERKQHSRKEAPNSYLSHWDY